MSFQAFPLSEGLPISIAHGGTGATTAATALTALGGFPSASILRSYLASTVTYNNNAVLANTALSVTVEASGIYGIELVVHSTSAVSALNMDFGGTATVTNFIGEWRAQQAVDPSQASSAQATSAGDDFDVALDGVTSFITFTGSIEVNAAGTFLLRGAQNAADMSATTILRGSTLQLTKYN